MVSSGKESSVSFRSLVEFDWAAEWSCGRETGLVTIRAYHALEPNRSLPMPAGWHVAVQALRLRQCARDTCDKEKPLDVSKLDCRLLGQPRRVPALTDETSLAPGACVALVEAGRRVNYVLVAHIYSDHWLCRSFQMLICARLESLFQLLLGAVVLQSMLAVARLCSSALLFLLRRVRMEPGEELGRKNGAVVAGAYSQVRLQACADKAAEEKANLIRKRVGDPDLQVSCRYPTLV